MRRQLSRLLLSMVFIAGSIPLAALAQGHSFDSNVAPRVVDDEQIQSERSEQESLFNYYFRDRDLQYETCLDDLATEASVPSWRIPYSAAIHPESSGGLSDVRAGRTTGLFPRRRRTVPSSGGGSILVTYDRAFNGGQDLANAYEIKRIMGTARALFPGLRMRNTSESWEGYCSGFTASTIKHPEPVRPVDAGDVGGTRGVVLQPSDIKGMLTCIYNRTVPDSYLYLAPPTAGDGGPNMGTFHLALANYIGQAGHPVGMDRTKGQVAWNNPIYSYKVDSIREAGGDDDHQFKEVQTTVTYSYYGTDSQRQTDAERGELVGNRKQSMTFRYRLALDDQGRIAGGRALSSSGHFLWIPLYPVQAKPDGSVPGNPYVDVKKVMALARASALPEIQEKFDRATIGPTVEPALEVEAGDTTNRAEE